MSIKNPLKLADPDVITHKMLVERVLVKSCLNCDKWAEDKCKLASATPPPEVIVYGCPAWIMDVPF